MNVTSFHDYVHHMHMNGNQAFKQEYEVIERIVSWRTMTILFPLQLLPMKPDRAQTAAALACNVSKNRFSNILPCKRAIIQFSTPIHILLLYSLDDENRVKLNELPGSDFINASYIAVNIYIACRNNSYHTFNVGVQV